MIIDLMGREFVSPQDSDFYISFMTISSKAPGMTMTYMEQWSAAIFKWSGLFLHYKTEIPVCNSGHNGQRMWLSHKTMIGTAIW